MNKMKFLNRFFLFSGISRMRADQLNLKGENYEENVVRNCNCDPNWPMCLYDFTYKIM